MARMNMRSFIVFLAILASCHLAIADEKPRETPVVLFLSIAPEKARMEMEERISSQLALTLLGFEVKTITEGMGPFRTAPLSDRLNMLKQVEGIDDAVATVWVEQAPGIILLNLVALSTGQALVRIVEAKSGPETPALLALTVQELLGQAYLFQQAPLPEQLRQTVSVVTRTAASAREKRGEEGEREQLKWAALLSAGAMGGISSFKGPSTKFIASLAFARHFRNGLFVFPEARFLLGPERMAGDLFLSSVGAGVAVGLGYGIKLNRISFNPTMTVVGAWQKADVGFTQHEIRSFHWFNGSFEIHIGFQIQLARRVFLELRPGISLNGVQKFFHRVSDGTVVFTSPRLEWGALFTLGMHI